MDTSIFYWLHAAAGLSGVGDAFILFFGEWYLYVLLAVFICAALSQLKKEGTAGLYPYALALLAALIARLGLTELIRHFYIHERPFVALGVSHLLTDASSSFPSGHTIFIFALAAATHFFNKKLAYFLYVSGLVVGVARIMGGVHYPSDILGGIILGGIVGVLLYWVGARFLPTRSDSSLG